MVTAGAGPPAVWQPRPARLTAVCPYTAAVPPWEIASLLALGLLAGAVGGLVGVGGSVVIIPALTLLLHTNQHLSQAVAMIINVLIPASSLLQHHRADAVRWAVVGRMLPFGLLFIIVGVELSNVLPSVILMRLYGVFMIWVVVHNVMQIYEERGAANERPTNVSWPRVGVAGSLMGFAGGLLGIGGAPVAIPLLQSLNHLPLRQAIAATSAVMVITAGVGAAEKNLALGSISPAAGGPLAVHDSLRLAACLAPTAVIGALLGATLTHVLPVRWVRVAFVLLMAWATVEMLGLR